MTEESLEKKKLEELESKLKKKYGDNYFAIKGNHKKPPIEWISSGYYALDYVFGKGVPVGKLIQLYGWESCGKSLIAETIATEYQKQNKLVFWVEAGETSLDREFAEAIGLDVDRMAFLTSETAEDAADAIREVLKSGVFDLVVVDSIAGMSPEKEQEDSLADANMALLARLLSKGLKQFTTYCEKHNTTLLIINQIRHKPGVMYGNPETTSGGNALKFFSHIIAKVSKKKVIEEKKRAIGIVSSIKTTKNKCATPFREKEISIRFPYVDENGEIKAGIDIIEDLIPEAITQNIIEQKGANYTWRGNKIYSRDKLIAYFKENPEFLNQLREDLLNNNYTNADSTEESYESEETTEVQDY